MIEDNVTSFADNGPRSQFDLGIAFKESAEADDLAVFIYAADQRLGRADMAMPFERLTDDQRESYITRAAIAIRLGDPLKARVVAEHCALGIIADVTTRIREQRLDRSQPETQIPLPVWRELAKVGVLRALEYLGNTPRRNTNQGERE